jgi:hypothetical protein
MVENKFLVGVQGDDVVVGLPMRTARMTKPEALEYAAWLVSLATYDPEKEFQPVLDEILGG